MPIMEGQSLRALMDSQGRLPVDVATRVAGEVADALDYAHRNDMVHRDIEPENILLHEEHALVAEFGIGKAIAAATDEIPFEAASVPATIAKRFIHTPPATGLSPG